MLTARQLPSSSASPPATGEGLSSLLATSGFAVNIPISTRRLQVLSYVLAELSSAATLLEDYVRAMRNISHRLLAAWKSIATAANACNESGSEQNANTTRKRDACRRSGNAAARHVEFVRRVVVKALFYQFLHVAVEDSSGDSLLRGWLGPGFRTDFCDARNFEGPRRKNGSKETYGPHVVPRFGRGIKRRRGLFATSGTLQLSTGLMPPDGGDGAQLTLQLFMRAALLFNPTVCAQELMSRCVVRIRFACRANDEVGGRVARNFADIRYGTNDKNSIGTGKDEECGDGLFCVFIAPRVVDPCEHSGLCFGNRKFIFVRYTTDKSRVAHVSEWGREGRKGNNGTEYVANTYVQQAIAREDEEEEGEYTDEDHEEGEEEEEEEMIAWLVLHATQCSATGAFFDSNPMPYNTARLLTYRSDALRQALLLPPNAGHDTQHASQAHEDSTPGSASGDMAFTQELCERLGFWFARGQPRRMYYDPCVADADCSTGADGHASVPLHDFTKSSSVGVSAHKNHTDSNSHGNASARTEVCAALPLLLLFSHVGVIEFSPLSFSVSAPDALAGQTALRQALEEATEVVVVAVRECRRHRRWHSHAREKPRPFGNQKSGGGTLSRDTYDPFAYGRYDDVETEAHVMWAHGETSQSKVKENEEITAQSSSRRTLSVHEQQQRHNKRLATEFRLSHSRRLDVLLVDARYAKPLAALVLRQSYRPATRTLEARTTFTVCSFSHYVASLLQHLRAEKAVMIDMDRTLVDNAIVVRDGKPERHYEAMGKITYPVAKSGVHDSPNLHTYALRSETVYVRPGARRLLRRVGLEWGIPLLLVTKSSSSRTEAVLVHILDPKAELLSRAQCFTAENLVGSETGHTDVVNALKSTHSVLRQWKPNGTTRAVAVLDDTPHVWEETDWQRTVPVEPYTLERVDPVEYFGDEGYVASLMLDALYSHKSVVCTCTSCDADFRGPTMSSVTSDIFSSSSSEDEEVEVASNEETKYKQGCPSQKGTTGGRLYPRTPPSSFYNISRHGVCTESAPLADAVVEEDGEGSDKDEYNSWVHADVEEVLPL